MWWLLAALPILQVRITPQDPYAGRISWLSRLYRRVHPPTRPWTVRALLLYREGDTLTPGRLRRIKGFLEATGLFSEVHVTVDTQPAGVVLHVETRDVQPLALFLDVRGSPGAVHKEVGLEDLNLQGLGVSAWVHAGEDPVMGRFLRASGSALRRTVRWRVQALHTHRGWEVHARRVPVLFPGWRPAGPVVELRMGSGQPDPRRPPPPQAAGTVGWRMWPGEHVGLTPTIWGTTGTGGGGGAVGMQMLWEDREVCFYRDLDFPGLDEARACGGLLMLTLLPGTRSQYGVGFAWSQGAADRWHLQLELQALSVPEGSSAREAVRLAIRFPGHLWAVGRAFAATTRGSRLWLSPETGIRTLDYAGRLVTDAAGGGLELRTRLLDISPYLVLQGVVFVEGGWAAQADWGGAGVGLRGSWLFSNPRVPLRLDLGFPRTGGPPVLYVGVGQAW